MMIDSLGSLGFSFLLKNIFWEDLSITSLQVVTHVGCRLEKNNCFIIRIKDESEENVYCLGKQETPSLALLQLRDLSYFLMQQVLSNFKSL